MNTLLQENNFSKRALISVALKAFFNITKQWNLSAEENKILLAMSRRMRASGTSKVKAVSKTKTKKNKPSKSAIKASQELVKAKDKVDKATVKLRQTISQIMPSLHQGKRRKGSKKKPTRKH